MLVIGAQDAVNLLRFFDGLPHPRSNVNRLHRLGDVIVMAICAVLANADDPTAMAQWAKLNAAWLRRHLALPGGIPGNDTFRPGLGLLPPATFQQCVNQWLQTLQTPLDEDSEDKEHIAIDGKALCRSHDRQHGWGPVHIVSAWASGFGITLGQVATEEKSNEITAIPQLLERIDVQDAIVTLDAAGGQKTIAAQIVQGKGDYVLALKGNQEKIFQDAALLMLGHFQGDGAGGPVSRYVEVEQGHGRLEARTYYQMTAPSYLHGGAEWKGLRTIGAAVRVCEEKGIEKRDVRYYLSSLRRNGPQFAQAVRRHWGIENSLHWSLDMTCREDESRVRNRTFAENLSWLRRLTLGLIKQHPGKQSNIMKRRMAGWSPDFLTQLLTGKGT
ncbi:MAG: ISAs1 family transposase [Planctomycetes bacterium]|nr:ISAs1 family transposase [Planctomycetota bacterium]